MELHDMFKKVKKPVAARIMVSENIAGLVSHYYSPTPRGMGFQETQNNKRDFPAIHGPD